MITVKDLHKHFGDLEVLNGIDQHIKAGEKPALILCDALAVVI